MEFRKVIAVKPLNNEKGWEEFDFTFEDGEVLTIAVTPDAKSAGYVPEVGDEISPLKSKIGKYLVGEKGFRKGRGVVKKTPAEPTVEAKPLPDLPDVENKEVEEFDSPILDWFNSEDRMFLTIFEQLSKYYIASISNRSTPKEVEALIDSCFDKSVDINERRKSLSDSQEHLPEKTTKVSQIDYVQEPDEAFDDMPY